MKEAFYQVLAFLAGAVIGVSGWAYVNPPEPAVIVAKRFDGLYMSAEECRRVSRAQERLNKVRKWVKE